MTILPLSLTKLNRILPILALTLLAACQDPVEKDPKNWGWLVAPQDKILVKLAIDLKDQVKGFSGTRDADWPDDHGILFLYSEDGPRAFWMPDTYFDLDLFFIDASLKVIDVERKVPHFIGRFPDESIPRIRSVWARHVLELKSKSAVSQRLKVGDQLHFQSPEIPRQIK